MFTANLFIGTTTIGPNSCLGYAACYKANNGKNDFNERLQAESYLFLLTSLSFLHANLAIIGTGSCTGDSIKGSDNKYGYSCGNLKGR